MIKKMHKNILGLFLISLTLYAICYLNVSAEENPDKCSESALSERYKGLNIRVNGTGATIYANELSEGLNGVKFTLTRINNVSLDSSSISVVSKKASKADDSNSKYVDLNVSKYNITNNVATLYFNVENDSNAGCKNIEHKVTVEGVGRSPKIDTYKEPDYDLSKITYGRDIICSSPKDNFEKAICKAREVRSGKNDNPSGNNLFKCNYESVYKSDDLKGECYYKEENTNYLYHKESKTVDDLGSYVYHFSPGVAPDPVPLTCTQECEEAVEVKYGPPVASKAGMCFEYKVKVVSRVNCHSNADIPKPTNYDVCTPTPICTNGSWSGNNGGPNEEFDSCIKSCDGGKYTKSCSKKCYKKVYGKTNKLSNNLAINYATKLNAIDDAIKTCAKNNKTCEGNDDNKCYGCYYNDGDEIRWSSLGSFGDISLDTCTTCGSNYSTPSAPGRWYYYNNWGNTSYYMTNENGIFKAPNCSDDCYWAGCDGNVYLNKYNYDKDYADNKKTYENAVNKCKAAASCSESTATFTIKAGYKTGGKSEIKWIDFPYETKKDEIVSNSNGFVSSTDDKSDTTFIDDKYDCKVSSNGSCVSCLKNCSSGDTNCINNCKKDENCDLLPDNGNRGCYDRNTNKTDRYRATWTFPFTYINLKTGEVSYKNLGDSPAWFKENKKFCIPLDADDINEKWWNYYYGKTTTDIKDKLSTSSTDANCIDASSVSILNDSDIEWNIKANTTDFGYFKWKIEVNCFFALNSKATVASTNVKEKNCTSMVDNYRVRSVQLNNLFPTTGGEEGSRNPGFNWSSYANTESKNSNYASTPVELTNHIQKHADDVYSDKYLDYEFNLSKSTLKAMKDEVEKSGLNYTTFNDKEFTVGSDTHVSRYVSKKIRDLAGNNKTPNNSALKCNNMENWESSNCEDLSK